MSPTTPTLGPFLDAHVEPLGRPPIFILGMLQRTGTNHLWDMIALHPDVDALRPVFEDHLVRWTHHIDAYIDDVTRCWSPEWDVPTSEGSALAHHLGQGVARWVASHSDRRVVTKMPSVERLESFATYFADCPLVLLVRDGRSVCESGVKSFAWSYERAFVRWRDAARAVLDLRARADAPEHMIVVRYEDLVDRPAEVMREVCTTVGLDPDRYPYDEIEALPVRGSSTVKSEQGSDLHWAPVERTESFKPNERWSSWTDDVHRRFNEVAGTEQVALGYDCVDVGGSTAPTVRLRNAYDELWDVRRRHVRIKLGRVRRAVMRNLKS
ncbi:MAG: sulfotransferase [Actinomycetota bacterium]